jgi:predicted metal-dependent phosphoesterase TrpH
MKTELKELNRNVSRNFYINNILVTINVPYNLSNIFLDIERYFNFDDCNKDIKEKFNINVIQDFLLSDRLEVYANKYGKDQKAYINRPIKNVINDGFSLSYDLSTESCILKSKGKNDINIIFNNEIKNTKVVFYTLRECIYRYNQNNNRTPLHSAAFSYNDKGVIIMGNENSGKTSLLLAFLKLHGSSFISNDITFVSPEKGEIYGFPLATLVSIPTIKSLLLDDFEFKCKDIPTITYFKESLNELVTKYKFSPKDLQNILNCYYTQSANFNLVIVPNYKETNNGVDIKPLNINSAFKIFKNQILTQNDGRYVYDYLNINDGEINNKSVKDEDLYNFLKNKKIFQIDYGKDIYEKNSLLELFKFLNNLEKTKICLHCHSNCSDGQLKPEEVFYKALENGLSILSITDHNNIDSAVRINKIKDKYNLKYINGIELDCSEYACLHILGLGIKDIDKMKEFTDYYQKVNNKVLLEIINKLELSGVNISYEILQNYCGKDKIFKHDVMDYLFMNGYARDRLDVIEKFLGKGKMCYIPRIQPSSQEVIKIIHACGGKAILAHPFELLKYNNLEEYNVINLIEELKQENIDGIECITPKHTKAQVDKLKEYCAKNNLLITQGTDFHKEKDIFFDEIDNVSANKLLKLFDNEGRQDYVK